MAAAKLPSLADHYETPDIASPPDRMDSPSDYSDDAGEAGDIGGEVAEGGIADDVVRNAPETQNHFFLVPKVVE